MPDRLDQIVRSRPVEGPLAEQRQALRRKMGQLLATEAEPGIDRLRFAKLEAGQDEWQRGRGDRQRQRIMA